jgi:hypothetical protein
MMKKDEKKTMYSRIHIYSIMGRELSII